MATTTDLADINETLLAYCLNGGEWFDKDAKGQHDRKRDLLTPDEYIIQAGRARVMCLDVKRWAQNQGYSGRESIQWTARKGDIQRALGENIDFGQNPSDILLKYRRGPSEGYLGISAKSTGSKRDIGFKNPGTGTLDEILNLNMTKINEEASKEFKETYDLPDKMNERKRKIESDKTLKAEATKKGDVVLEKIRDSLFKKFKSMNDKERASHMVNYWLSSSGSIFPPYIIVTGRGESEPFSSEIKDPLSNNKVARLTQNKITFSKSGKKSIDVKGGGQTVFKIRVKFSYCPMAGSVTFSAER